MLIWLTLTQPFVVHAAALTAPDNAPMVELAAQLQTSGPRFVPLLITPLEATRVQLQMHAADFYFDDSSGNLILAVESRYRLKNNSTEEPATVALRIAPMIAADASAPVEGLSLLADNRPVSLAPGDAGIYTAQVEISADARTDLLLAYTVDMQQQKLPLLEYVVVGLQRWSGSPSLRVTATVPGSITQPSWLRIGPDGWHFFAEDADRLGAKWLYDAKQPDAPFILHFIHPALWSQLNQLTQRTQSDATVSDFAQLGDLYQQLVMAAMAENAPGAVRERFYAQALAAYTTGIDRLAATAPPAELATLYTGLATLYRSRIADGAGAVYAMPLAEATQAALDRLPADDARRRELTQWLADGLQVLLTEAQQRQDWQNALRLADQLAALPSDVVDSITLAKTKRLLLVQQALQLLAEDNRAAATALGGDELRDPSLLPPPSADTLFSRWSVTVTITPQQQQVEIVGQPIKERVDDATAAFTALADLWQTVAGRGATFVVTQAAAPAAAGEANSGAQASTPLQMVLTGPPTRTFADFVNLIPPRADWALLRTLLEQLQPTIAQERAWLDRRWTITQFLALAAAAEQWQGMATTLERQATQFEAESAGFDTTDAVGAENALRARVQAANYRSAAQQWQKLTRDSLVAVRFTGQTGTQERTWLLTPVSPAQQLALTIQPASSWGAVTMAVFAFIGLFLLTAFLWWLL
ncbi:MAG: hypothetical protein DYG89_18940 [Caldilinea sp. CFX5]|nr:hypothetical protein [Caldilinea sp. CFX5]